ncbi:MAG: hypothetical protein ACQEXB_27330 [Bacillota bacterium]
MRLEKDWFFESITLKHAPNGALLGGAAIKGHRFLVPGLDFQRIRLVRSNPLAFFYFVNFKPKTGNEAGTISFPFSFIRWEMTCH